MKRPARWLTTLALAACVLAWWWNRPPPEPMYLGRPLSKWMLDSVALAGIDSSPIDFKPIVQHLRSEGAPAVKWLAYTAEYGHSDQKEQGMVEKTLAKIHWWDSPSKWPYRYDERSYTMGILSELGALSKPAFPALVRVLGSGSYRHVLDAAFALNRIGSASWPVVEERLMHGSNLARCELLYSIYVRLDPEHCATAKQDAPEVFDLLRKALQDPEPNIRRNAASALTHCIDFASALRIPGSMVDQTAAALWPLPDGSNKEVRGARRATLDYYHGMKAESVPRLTALLADPDEAKRNFARAVLEQLKTTPLNAENP